MNASDLTVKDAFHAMLECPQVDLMWLISAPGEIHFSSWGISMHRLALIGMVITYKTYVRHLRHVLVPMVLEL